MGLRLGLDAGGTFTDAALLDDDGRVVATAKAPTRHDRSIGIGEGIDLVLARAGIGGGEVASVALATTLATNALVEGTGGPVALVFIGFSDAELDRGGLRTALGGGPVILADGGHDAHGTERRPVDVDAVVEAARGLEVDAFAVTAAFGVRNPSHERAVRDALVPLGRPVTCGHDLSAALDGPRRALTCVLNAGLTGLVADLCRATRGVLDDRAIAAPLLVVRGDGSVMSAEVAVERPIETILSGPAASLIGAAHLVARDDVAVADIGGTTTDVGLLRSGRPVIGTDGATVGGHRTMVEAVEVTTTGLGGDSEIGLDNRGAEARLVVGPRRVLPLSVLAAGEPDLVRRRLAAVERPARVGDLTFVCATGAVHPPTGRPGGEGEGEPGGDRRPGEPDGVGGNGANDGVARREARLLSRMATWTPLSDAATSRLERATLDNLVRQGRVRQAGFTPTDAARVLGLHDLGDGEVAARAADLLATASGPTGRPVRDDGRALARWVVDTVVRRSAEAVLDVTLRADGFPPETATGPLATAALDRRAASATPTDSVTDASDLPAAGPAEATDRLANASTGISDLGGAGPVEATDRSAARSADAGTGPGPSTVLDLGPAVPLVGLGAGAGTYHPGAADLLGVEALVPADAAVAGAVGAAVGGVRVTARATISQPTRGQFRVHLPDAGDDRGDVEPAIERAVELLSEQVTDRAIRAGAATVDLAVDVTQRRAEVAGKVVLVEATVTVTGTGPPERLPTTTTVATPHPDPVS